MYLVRLSQLYAYSYCTYKIQPKENQPNSIRCQSYTYSSHNRKFFSVYAKVHVRILCVQNVWSGGNILLVHFKTKILRLVDLDKSNFRLVLVIERFSSFWDIFVQFCRDKFVCIFTLTSQDWGNFVQNFFFQLSTDQWLTKNKGSITSFSVSYNLVLVGTSVDLIILVLKKITALEKSVRICPTTCTNLPHYLYEFTPQFGLCRKKRLFLQLSTV